VVVDGAVIVVVSLHWQDKIVVVGCPWWWFYSCRRPSV